MNQYSTTVNSDSDCISLHPEGFTIKSHWFIPASRHFVYAVASDFEHFSQHFPRIAHSTRVVSRVDNRLVVEAEAASFGRFFPRVYVTINVELLPGEGYRCSTLNHTFNTTGEEELLLSDAAGGTRITYSYTVTVRRKLFLPLYAWLVRRFALRYWKCSYLEPLTLLSQQREDAAGDCSG